ncbi:DUF6115 domain-containing protein [Caenibacillus caldisaponilyticus]|uniref:DUF6115 domain-containing protein n=1 Tax=Caenibacillus caldisaponilyticus TaxID=1674942 RepID=UPI0009884C07|nr:hypothetical protein [Caenibacillus caldisaponilyticus]
MISVLLVFSLLLHLVTFYLLILLTQRINQLKHAQSEHDLEAIDAALSAHLEAVRAENQALLDALDEHQVKRDQAAPIERREEAAPREEQTSARGPAEERTPSAGAEAVPAPPPIDGVQDRVEPSLSAQVLHLAEAGHDVEHIAKQLKIGKGEVELMLNLHRKQHAAKR